MASRYTCPVCYRFSAPTFQSVLTHVGSVHSWEPNFKITCGIEECPRIYTSYRSYRKHILQKHADFMNGSVYDPGNDPSSSTDNSEEMLSISPHESTPSSATVPVTHSMALFILKAKEERKIPQLALDGLLDDFHEIFKIQMNALGENIKKCLKELNCTSHVITAVDQAISSNAAVSPFDGLHTAYLQQQYFRKHFHFVVRTVSYTYILMFIFYNCIVVHNLMCYLQEPVEGQLGQISQMTTVATENDARINLSWDTVYDIPLLDSLEQQLSDEHILDEVHSIPVCVLYKSSARSTKSFLYACTYMTGLWQYQQNMLHYNNLLI